MRTLACRGRRDESVPRAGLLGRHAAAALESPMEPLLPSFRRELRARAHHLASGRVDRPARPDARRAARDRRRAPGARARQGARVQRRAPSASAMLADICAALECAAVQQIGKLLVLWRARPPAEKPSPVPRPPRKARPAPAPPSSTAAARRRRGTSAIGCPRRQRSCPGAPRRPAAAPASAGQGTVGRAAGRRPGAVAGALPDSGSFA